MEQPDLLIRAAKSDDMDVTFKLFAEIQSVHANAEPDFFRQPKKDKKFEQFFTGVLSDPNQYIVFCCADKTEVGYVHYFLGVSPETIYQPERRIAHIGQLVVTTEHRRAGYATRLIEHVKEEAIRQEIVQVGLELWLFNAAARACFEKGGFKINQGSKWLNL